MWAGKRRQCCVMCSLFVHRASINLMLRQKIYFAKFNELISEPLANVALSFFFLMCDISRRPRDLYQLPMRRSANVWVQRADSLMGPVGGGFPSAPQYGCSMHAMTFWQKQLSAVWLLVGWVPINMYFHLQKVKGKNERRVGLLYGKISGELTCCYNDETIGFSWRVTDENHKHSSQRRICRGVITKSSPEGTFRRTHTQRGSFFM